MISSPEQLATLSPEEKRRLLARLLAQKIGRSKARPLSFAQERLWFLEQLQPGGGLNVISAAIHLSGSLSLPALEQSLT